MIIVKLIGGLGNQMFQYAIGRAIAYKNNDVFKLDITGFKNYKFHNGYRLNAFNIDEKIAYIDEIKQLGVRNKILNKLLRMGIYNYKKDTFYVEKPKNETKFDPKVFSYKNLYLNGYWQNEKYFLDIKDIIVKEFTLKKSINENATKYMKFIKNSNSISIHVRRGDYLKTDSFLGIEYYRKAYAYILDKIDNFSFFIFSDDIEWCKENLNFIANPIFVENTTNELEDLELMKNAKHNIIANSSFSWWAAWLNTNKDKIIIAPNIWFKCRYGFDPVPETWIKL
ncbi:MAG: alpha-1,2-fucosyltransferase [Campylobacteraceae bacterium]|jgi:hypothetical protein|nr:alpha-1,2-fucosyltransferase [Campylobacteraceae bacterium]